MALVWRNIPLLSELEASHGRPAGFEVPIAAYRICGTQQEAGSVLARLASNAKPGTQPMRCNPAS